MRIGNYQFKPRLLPTLLFLVLLILDYILHQEQLEKLKEICYLILEWIIIWLIAVEIVLSLLDKYF